MKFRKRNSIEIILILATLSVSRVRSYTKRDTASLCDPSGLHSVQCYCTMEGYEQKVIKNADCYLTNDTATADDKIWENFSIFKDLESISFSKTGDKLLKYIPQNAFKNLPSLRKIDVKYARIDNIESYSFANLSNLQEIILRDNQIKVLAKNAFAHHKSLTLISLDQNNLEEINRHVFTDMPSLEKLYLTNNKIAIIHDKAFHSLGHLKELEVDRNKIFSLNPDTFSGLHSLIKLDLSNNLLEIIGDNTFIPLKSLQTLNLGENKIEALDEKAFNGLEKLRSLSLAHNKLTELKSNELFAGMKSLTSLSLRGNQIHDMKAEVIKPILHNFISSQSVLDVEDNNFPCDCRIEWFVYLMNKTQNNHLKLTIENLKCQPSNDLREMWTKTEELDKNVHVLETEEENQGQLSDYEYYDDTQLNGKLFYMDVRDLLNCSNSTKLHHGINTKSFSSNKKDKLAKDDSINGIKTESFENKDNANKIQDISNSLLSDNHVFDRDMADEAKPDKLKAHRSIQNGDIYNGCSSYNRISKFSSYIISLMILIISL